jgi:hypothetical protein
LKGIELLDEYPHSKYLTCIVSKVNRDDVLDVMRFARNHGMIPVLGAYHWDVSRYGKIDLTLQYQKSTATAVFQEVLESNVVPDGYFRKALYLSKVAFDGPLCYPLGYATVPIPEGTTYLATHWGVGCARAIGTPSSSATSR